MNRKVGVSVCLLATIVLIIGVGALSGGTGIASGDDVSNAEETPIDIETDRVSIDLHAQRTSIDHDEKVVFIYSVTNYITNNESVSVQLILEAPLGSQVSASRGQESGSGSQFTTTTTLERGGQETLRIEVDLNEPGTHEILGEAVYFFGDNRSTGEGREISVTVTQASPTSLSERVISAPGTVYSAIADTAPDGTVQLGQSVGEDASASSITRSSAIASTIIFLNVIFILVFYYTLDIQGAVPAFFIFGIPAWIATVMFIDWLKIGTFIYTMSIIISLLQIPALILAYILAYKYAS